MRKRESNTAERRWRDDPRSRPTYQKKEVKQPKAISIKHVIYPILFVAVIIEIFQHVHPL